MNVCTLSPFSRVQSLPSYGPYFAGFLCPWDSPGKNMAVGCHFLLQDLSDQGIEPESLVSCIGRWVFTTSATWEAYVIITLC